jgi:hypothetical protein
VKPCASRIASVQPSRSQRRRDNGISETARSS